YADAGGAITGTSEYQRMKFEAILRGEMLMGIVAHNIGRAEAALGADSLREIAKRLNVPLISANAFDSKDQPIAEAYRIASANGRRVAIIGLLSPQFVTDSIHITEPRAALQKTLADIKDKFDLLVVLAYMP